MQLRASLLVAAFSVIPAASFAQDAGREVFRGEVAAGSWLRVRTLKGDIEVRETSGRTAVVRVRERSRRDSDGTATFEVKRDGSNVTVCAIYEHTTQCDADEYNTRRRYNDSDYTSADFTVELPRGVRLLAATGNGDVETRGATADVTAASGNGEVSVNGSGGRVNASSGNGDIDVTDAKGPVHASSGNGDITVRTTDGPVTASSGNGRINVRMDRLVNDDNMSFSTGNGSIEVSLPANAAADVDANVGMRNFETDFPMLLEGRMSGGRIEGRINGGGRRIRMSTGNGRIAIRKNS
jgi:hypothetical protein